MEKIRSVGAQSEVESLQLQTRKPRSSGISCEEPRALADDELLLVGGGDDGPGWGHP